MKTIILKLVLVGALLLSGAFVQGQEQKDAKAQLAELIGKIQTQLKDGKKTDKDLEPFLKEFDVLLEQHKTEKTEDVAQILMMKAQLYLQVLDNDEKGKELLADLKKDFPDTKAGKAVDDILSSIQQQAAAKKIQKSLAVGTVFPDFDEKDMAGKPLSIANYKGKVVLLDFWATWCGPCVGELPNVIKTYKAYHDKGFEIIGISLDEDEAKLTAFLKEKEMTWVQYFDGKGWQSKLAGKYGVNSIPSTYLLDREGKIVAKGLRGEALEAEVSKLVAKP